MLLKVSSIFHYERSMLLRLFFSGILTLFLCLQANAPQAKTTENSPSNFPEHGLSPITAIANALRASQFDTARTLLQDYENTSKMQTTGEKAVLTALSAYAAISDGEKKIDKAKILQDLATIEKQIRNDDFLLFVRFLKAQTANLLSNYQLAHEQYEALIQADHPWFRVAALWADIFIFKKERRFQDEKNAILRAIKMEPSTFDTPEWTLHLAETMIQTGEEKTAHSLLTSLYVNMPQFSDDSKVEHILKEFSGNAFKLNFPDNLPKLSKKQWMTRFQRASEEEKWHAADTALNYLITTGIFTEDQGQFKRAELAFKRQDYSTSRSLFTEYLKSSHNKKQTRQAMEMLAASSEPSGNVLSDILNLPDIDTAIRTNERLIEMFPQSNEAHWARYNIAHLYLEKSDFPSALRQFSTVVDHGFSPTLTEGLWYAGWSAYRLQHFDQAIEFWKTLSELDKKQSYRALYWQARALERLGHTTMARSIDEKIAQEASFDYYGFLSLLRLQDPRSHKDWRIVPRGSTHWLTHVPNPLQPWTLETPQTLDAWILKNPKQDFSRFLMYYDINGAVLSTHSNIERNLEEAISSQNGAQLKDDLTFLLEGERVRDVQAWVALNHERLSLMFPHFKSQYFQFLYPRPFRSDVVSAIRDFNASEALVYAIMREGSGFDTNFRSLERTIGLMPIQPDLAKSLVRSMNMGNRVEPTDLTYPSVNIQIGTYHLHQLTQILTDVPSVIAAHKAGQSEVMRWKKIAGVSSDDWETFIELIPQTETQNYVKRVLASYWMYRRLYNL